MSRRIYQLLQASLKAVQTPLSRPSLIRRTPITSRNTYSNVNFMRRYATESPAAVPPVAEEIELSAEEQGRYDLHNQAG
jgi:hypothetical protein